MKNLLFILLTGLFLSILAPPKPLLAQSCSLTATINCDGSITCTVPVANPLWKCQMTKGQSAGVTSVDVQSPGNNTFLFPPGTVSDTVSIAFTYHDGNSLGCGYSTYIMHPQLGITVTGCSGSSTCTVSNITCPTSLPGTTPTTKRKKQKP